jgi:hypothetical protein
MGSAEVRPTARGSERKGLTSLREGGRGKAPIAVGRAIAEIPDGKPPYIRADRAPSTSPERHSVFGSTAVGRGFMKK